MKRMIGSSVRKALLVTVVLLALLAVHSPSAQSFCDTVIPSAGSTFLNSTGSINTILSVSLLLMLLMAAVAGMLYMIGYSFRINGLVRASKQEFGEIAITALIIFIFVGAFSLLAGTTINPTLLSQTGAYSRGIFYDDCSQLSAYALNLFEYSFDLGVVQDFTTIVSSITVNLHPDDFGVSFTPLAGYATSTKAIGLLFIFAGGMGGLLLAIGVVLGIFYALMPLFLFAGIILRTIPWTRPAGGAFLGLFLGFFIVFPLLLHFLIYNSPPSISPAQLYSPSFNDLLNILNPGASFSIGAAFLSVVDPSYTVDAIISVLVPALYGVFSFAFAFIISFDFTEVAGDFLGSPSLSASKSLNRLL